MVNWEVSEKPLPPDYSTMILPFELHTNFTSSISRELEFKPYTREH